MNVLPIAQIFLIEGRVQGVAYRVAAQRMATSLGLVTVGSGVVMPRNFVSKPVRDL